MKPLDSRVKDLEEERKKLDEKMNEDRERSACAEKCVEKTLNSIKAVLLAAKVPFTDAKTSSGRNATAFLRSLSAKDKTSLLETLKQRNFVLTDQSE